MSGVLLDPLRMAAAVSMTTPEEDAELERLLELYGDELERCAAASRYVIRQFGMDRIEAQCLRMLRGEMPLPPGWRKG